MRGGGEDGRGGAGHLKRGFLREEKGGASATKEKWKIGADVRDEDAIEGKRARLEAVELFLEQGGGERNK